MNQVLNSKNTKTEQRRKKKKLKSNKKVFFGQKNQKIKKKWIEKRPHLVEKKHK